MTEYIKRSDMRAVLERASINPRFADEPSAADVAPVVRGRWLYTDGYGLHHMLIVQCSVCRRASEGSLNDRYCPNCGAKMDKEEL